MSDGGGPSPGDAEVRRAQPGRGPSGHLGQLQSVNEHLRLPGRASRHRRLALALAAVGIALFAIGWYVPGSRDVLFALGGTGVFAGVLLAFLTPESYIPASVGGDVYAALATNQVAMLGELGLTDRRIYVPREVQGTGTASLFVPQRDDFSLPSAAALEDLFVVSDDGTGHGVSLRPSAGELIEDLATTGSAGLEDRPGRLAVQLADALREGYGLVDGVAHDVHADGGRASFTVVGGALGPADRFDDPVSSFLASGLAVGLGRPVTVEVTPYEGRGFDHVVTCRWSTADEWSVPPAP